MNGIGLGCNLKERAGRVPDIVLDRLEAPNTFARFVERTDAQLYSLVTITCRIEAVLHLVADSIHFHGAEVQSSFGCFVYLH